MLWFNCEDQTIIGVENTLAYFANVQITKVKSFKVVAPAGSARSDDDMSKIMNGPPAKISFS